MAALVASWAVPFFALIHLDGKLTKQAIDREAVRQFKENDSPDPAAFRWIVQNPTAEKLLEADPTVDLAK